MAGATDVRSIPFFNYQAAFTKDEEKYVTILRNVIRKGAFIQQQELADFEAHLAAYLSIRHVIGVGNATDGLIFAFRAAGLKQGDEVIFPSHTMVASPASVAHAGGTPVPVDCGPDHLIDPLAIEAAITSRTRFILPVQLNGRTCDMDRIQAIADKFGLTIIEDSAQALGSKYKGRFAGTFGIAGVFSFYPAKILGCFGDGGAVVTNSEEWARKINLLRDHGRNSDGEVEMWGFNSRLDNFQAAVLDSQFMDYSRIIDRRRQIAAMYQDQLASVTELKLPPAPDSDSDHFDVYQNYEMEAESRDQLRDHLRQRGIGTLIQWGGKAVHQFKALGLRADLPATDALFERCVMLPINMTLSNDDVSFICDQIRNFYGH